MREEKNQEVQKEELDLDDLEEVSGGSMRDVVKKPTTDISDNTVGRMS
jgi:hypothetical protein